MIYLEDNLDIPQEYVSGNILPIMTKEELKELLIEVFKLDEEPESVSGNDILLEPVPESVSGNDALEESVSGNSSVSSNTVSGNDYMPILTDMYAEMQQPTIWDKPLEDYTVTEGLLLLMFIILLVKLIGSLIKIGERHV